MEVRYSIVLQPEVITEDIPALDAFWKYEIRDAVRAKLATQPEVFGKPLRRSLRGIRTLRVGEYRVIFRLQGAKVYILAILHRSVVYEEMQKRIL